MSTNFFAHQDRARKRTGLLIGCFTAGLVLMVAAVYTVVVVVFAVIGAEEHSGEIVVDFWNPQALAWTAGLMIVLVGGSSLFKIIELRSGGRVVAEMLGAQLLDSGTRKREERIALNIVEEMAIASGLPVPPLYILEDPSINAFAAGWSPNDAVISLNRGTIQQLSRDELQGVVAHEFSHIFNGDMRINIRLIGILHGILMLGLTGWILMRFVGPMMMGSSRRSSKDGGGAAVGMAIMLIGLLLVLCGFIGTFFGRLIQAAVSRQREFLADASAVQFTRNPDGIAGALRKISTGAQSGVRLQAQKASEISHMLFTKGLDSIFATHPPLAERIARVEGLTTAQVEQDLRRPPAAGATPAAAAAPSHSAGGGGVARMAVLGAVLEDAVSNIGTVDEARLEESRRLLDRIPDRLRTHAQAMATARLVVIGLLLDEQDADRTLQWKTIERTLDASEVRILRGIERDLATLEPDGRLPLIDLCVPALATMSPAQYETFTDLKDTLIRMDGSIDRWEWVVDTVLDRHLGERFRSPGRERPSRGRLASRVDAVELVLAALAFTGAETIDTARESFRTALNSLSLSGSLPDPKEVTLSRLRTALRSLRRTSFQERGRLLAAAVTCVLHDGRTTVEEAETLRAVAESLDCPMPVLLPS